MQHMYANALNVDTQIDCLVLTPHLTHFVNARAMMCYVMYATKKLIEYAINVDCIYVVFVAIVFMIKKRLFIIVWIAYMTLINNTKYFTKHKCIFNMFSLIYLV